MNVRLDVAQKADIPVIFAQAKALVDAYEDLAAINYDKVMAWIEKKITDNISHYRCIVADGVRCAFWRLCEDGELDDLYVLPDNRNKGIGSLIMETCIWESDKGLYLYVFTRNTRAISFYQQFGFTVREKVSDTRCIMERKG